MVVRLALPLTYDDMTSLVAVAPMIDAVLGFPPSGVHLDSMGFRLTLLGEESGRASSLVRLHRHPASPTDVVEGTAEFVTSVKMLLSRWELHACHDHSLLAAGEVPPISVAPFAPLACTVRLFGRR
jgi:hypothetical protein